MMLNCRHREATLFVSIRGEVGVDEQQELLTAMQEALARPFEEVVFELRDMPLATKQLVGQYLMYYRNTAERGRELHVKGIEDGNLILIRQTEPVPPASMMAS